MGRLFALVAGWVVAGLLVLMHVCVELWRGMGVVGVLCCVCCLCSCGFP